jgi:hypothetical protein
MRQVAVLYYCSGVLVMLKSKVFLSLSLVGAIGAIEMLGFTDFVMPRSHVAQAARPYRRAVGGKRGVCQPNPKQPQATLMAFLPEAKPQQAADWSATNAPTLYFYVPEQSVQVADLEFRLDYADAGRRGNGVINPPLHVPIGNTPGVVKVQLPAVLVKDTTYAWSLTLRCQGSRDPVSLKGLVVYKDLASPVAAQVVQATSTPAKAQIYMQAGFAIDAVPLLMEHEQLSTQSFDEIQAKISWE